MRPRPRLLAAAAGFLVAGLIVWVAIGNNNDDGGGSTSASTDAEVVSIGGLRATADTQETPIYWAGRPDGSELELSRPSADRTYVRYLTGGAEVGDPRPFLTVGSYRLANPAKALRSQGKRAGGVLVSAPDGGVVYFNREQPQSVYLAYPGEDVEVEVFTPDFKQALELVTSGRIVPVE